MSGPLEELDHIRDWLGAPDMGLTYTADAAKGIVRKVLAAYDALLAASGTGERPECTGLTATWCPVHGACICVTSHQDPGHESGEPPDMDDPMCPLHGTTSDHPTPPGAGTGEQPADEVTMCPTCRHPWRDHDSFGCAVGLPTTPDLACCECTATPPDAGTGTPSDDGRRAPTPFECFQAGMFDGVVAGGKGRLAIDYDPGAVRAAFRSWLDEYVAERPTPAAPSGTTGATTGGRVGGCICVHDADAHVDGLGCVALDVDGEGCRCDADRPPSTGAESRDDR